MVKPITVEPQELTNYFEVDNLDFLYDDSFNFDIYEIFRASGYTDINKYIKRLTEDSFYQEDVDYWYKPMNSQQFSIKLTNQTSLNLLLSIKSREGLKTDYLPEIFKFLLVPKSPMSKRLRVKF